MTHPDFITAPAVVVGGGIAGLSAALGLDGCTVVADEPVGGGSSRLAQGGIAAAISDGDRPALHAADTVRVAAELADPGIAALVAEAAPDRIEWLRALGVGFDCTDDGRLRLGREAGHGRDRIVHAGGDRTGAAVMRALRAAVLGRPDIRRLEGFELVDIIACGARAGGVLLEAADGSAPRRAFPARRRRDRRHRRLLRPHDKPRHFARCGACRGRAPRRDACRPRVRAVPPDRARRSAAIPCPS